MRLSDICLQPPAMHTSLRSLLAVGADSAVALSAPSRAPLTFAGDMPPGARVRFMRASYEDLLDGAAHAAEQPSDQPADQTA